MRKERETRKEDNNQGGGKEKADKNSINSILDSPVYITFLLF